MKALKTPTCMHCKMSDIITVSDNEYKQLSKGMALQDVFPDRDADFRELMISGTHAECWDIMFPDDDNDDNQVPTDEAVF